MSDHTSVPQGQEAVDLVILHAMAKRLDDYLAGNRVYWPMSVETPQGTRWPTMSIGAMLSRLTRLRALTDRLTPEQRAVLEEVENELERARRWYPESYRSLVIREITSLLNSWRWFLDDCYENLEECASNYPAEARTRTTLQLLIDHLGEKELPPELLHRVLALDSRLRKCFHERSFIWAPELASAFPRREYWWLYGLPAAQAR